ncbi:putative quinol monooxygenase [Clostridium lacusfryxellense]|uniref:putative quinol monooxygenase n=1 Tax=Clostridium lacusfryxellense TaxID=205328 RepID=UPI001C0E12EA|nr:antibiotic biosynthesis monooxygenase [Clostridium lacusfryxellense]MBU3113839.1 antibiotic biosynthesis monooxygenase [Clostridium lacusfryxellense]
MIIKSVTMFIKAEFVGSFIEATIENQKNSIKEAGVIRFDVLQGKDEPTSFMFYEVYKDEEAVEKHMKTKHFIKWNEAVTPWFAKPRERVLYNAIVPSESDF